MARMFTKNKFKKLEAYPINETNIGHAYIFSNEIFDGSDYPDRKGNEHEENALKFLFEKMGFTVEILKDLTVDECEEKLKKISKANLPDESCLMVAFLSYGNLKEIQMKEGEIEVQEIIKRFTEDSCKYLIGKPKIFLFQTCVGKETGYDGEDMTDATPAMNDDVFDALPETSVSECLDAVGSNTTYIPKGADFFICYPTSPRYVSHRTAEQGSFFISMLADIFHAYLNDQSTKKIDFETLMTMVSKNISDKKNKQNPWFSSTLRKQLYFNKIVEPDANNLTELDTPTSDSTKDFIGQYFLDRYTLKEGIIGHAYIFSNEKFSDSANYRERKGNIWDLNALKYLLPKMGFHLEEPLQDLTVGECMQALHKISSEEKHSGDSCFLVAFLSHGSLNEIQLNDGAISVKSIMEMFTGDKCKHLENKPKVFLFQACRGNNTNNYVEFEDFGDDNQNPVASAADQVQYADEVGNEESYMPIGPDFICCHPTTPGYVSYRSEERGSFFIQTFKRVVAQYLKDKNSPEVDFVSLLKMVSQHVSLETAKTNNKGKKQMPWFYSSLKKQLYFSKAIQ